jgi:translocation and assembly module TamB
MPANPKEPGMSNTAAMPDAARRRSRALPIAAGVLLLLLLLGGLAAAWILSSQAVTRALDFAVARSGGRLAYELAEGSILGTMRIARLRYQDGGTRVVAEDIVATVSPRALLQSRIVLSKLGAARLAVELPPGDGSDIPLPASLALPFALSIDRIAIERVDWSIGAKRGSLDRVALAYAGDAQRHRIRDLVARTEGVTIEGEAELDASPAFATRGRMAVVLSPPHPAGRIDATVGGTLAALDVDARGTLSDIPGALRARVAPLAAEPLIDARGSASAIDLARLGDGWPTTNVELSMDVKPSPRGYQGAIEARNSAAGRFDASRVPLAEARADATLAGDTLTLEGLAARLAGGASVTGSASIDVRSGRSRWQVAVRDLDLAALHGTLLRSRLRGSLDADVREGVQVLRGDVRQDDLRLAFDARYDGREIVASRLVAEARGGRAEGSGRLALDAARSFALDARTHRFDPSRFGAFPEGTLDGSVAARGTLAPLAVTAEIVAASGSRLAGLPAQGRARGRFTSRSAEDVAADLSLGATRLTVEGRYGHPGDRLAIALTAKRLEEIAPLVRGAPKPLTGAIDARATIELAANGARVALKARADKLAVGTDVAFNALEVAGSAVHEGPVESPRLDSLREVVLDFAATGARTPAGSVASARGRLTGAVAAHTLALDAVAENGRLEARASGSLATTAQGIEWHGRVESLAARDIPGFVPIALAAPVTIDYAADRLALGPARLDAGELRADIEFVEWHAGALASRGRFRGLPLAPLIRQAGLAPRWPSDLTLEGAWDVAFAADWRGTARIARERGDVYADNPDDAGAAPVALGLETFVVDARLEGGRVKGTAELRAKIGGNALAEFEIAAPPSGRHPFAAAAPLRATVRAHLPSLASLQPWIGTSARVRGQAIADVDVAGTLGNPVLAGQLVGYGLQLDMPQYGVHWRDGRLRIASGPDGLNLEEFEIAAGDGRFVASGAIGLPRSEGGASTPSRIAWRAEDFRALNRPDMRVVVDGEGTLATVGGRLVLRGTLKADEGNFEYRSTADTALADDIVVVGRPRPSQARPADAIVGDTPLDLDLTLDLGRNLRFAGEGLEARLAGRLQVTSRPGRPIEGRGTIRTVRGTYWAFGQKLDIDRGRVIFDGPLANPSLDIVALRRNLPVEAGVEVTGNVRAPVVRLTSNPPVPDSEKLSWLLTGGPSGSTSAKEAAALSAATAALVGRGGKSITQQVAQSIGLDEISVAQRSSGAGTEALQGQVVTVGKRLTDRLYVSFEQGLTIATNALRIEYVLSRYFTLSAFTGTSSGVAVNFRRSWR